MIEAQLEQGTLDWHLPVRHEQAYWREFQQGGRTFLDIGAHVGTWTLNLARKFERVFAFEPDPRSWRTLEANLRKNGITNVTVVPKAVASGAGSVKLMTYPNPSTNTMMPALGRADSPTGMITVDAVGLDEFCAEHNITDVDFVKCDAEGAEMLILEGAQRLFTEQRPDFFIEMHGLFYDRLRRLLPGTECDVLDGGRAGLSLLRHRDAWPGFASAADFRVYPHPTKPSIEDQRELRRLHGIPWDPLPEHLAELDQ